jgi:hypothetical protein
MRFFVTGIDFFGGMGYNGGEGAGEQDLGGANKDF